jgi:FlaA1/EpsC-like NDP-sugar epimerase
MVRRRQSRTTKSTNRFQPDRIFIRSAVFAVSAIIAFLLRFDFPLADQELRQMGWAIAIWCSVKSIVFLMVRADRGSWCHATLHELVALGLGNLEASLLSVPVVIALAPGGFPRSVYIIDCLVCTFLLVGARSAAKIRNDFMAVRRSLDGKRIVIYGAGAAGASLVRELHQNTDLGYHVCGFIDDDPMKEDTRIEATRILGGGNDLPEMAKKHALQEVLIAIPSADGQTMGSILQRCQNAGLKCRTIPGLGDIMRSRALMPQVRDVAVQDLLGRTPVALDETILSSRLEDNVVMVTGAGGSIGSELCRQIARFRPKAIIGYEVAETALFEIDSEMRRSFPGVQFIPELGSIQNSRRVREVIEQHSPIVLYHAAAYKHVPMMEAHLFEAAENNILGTANVAELASEHGVALFVMISSDKAVRPTNIMGATKRVAELLINSLDGQGTRYVSVRFGNVLGSNGSVIPIFKRQIAAGGPVTITHPDMRRYLMTIPEAAQLVLQASIMGSGGEIFVLDMGQQVMIRDLARNLILLSGLRPDEDIRIEFTGVRPGEKLYEELNELSENTLPTFHEKIKIFSGAVLPRAQMEMHLDEIRDCCRDRCYARLFLTLKSLVPEYSPSVHVVRELIFVKSQLQPVDEQPASVPRNTLDPQSRYT